MAARIAQESEKEAYKVYITDRLLEIQLGLYSFSGSSDMEEVRYIEMIHPELFPKEPEKTAEEIIEDTLSKYGLEVRENV